MMTEEQTVNPIANSERINTIQAELNYAMATGDYTLLEQLRNNSNLIEKSNQGGKDY